MAKASVDEKALDGLEIVSIGKMYSGPWEKKYWSSSRGKDRYPYPIGYNAVRTHNGIRYKMEILEGLKGPLFMISSTDGKSCSGQTPDIAWDCFQKKGFSQIKLWHGKRFSCKIDGVEFFGFRNAFVQRLLRELVANVSGTVEWGFPPSSFCSGPTETRHQPESVESTALTDLLPCLAKPRVTRKRSRKDKVINVKSLRVDVLQKHCPQDGNDNSDASNSSATSAIFCASDENYGSCGSPRALPVNLDGGLEKEEEQTLSGRDSKFNFSDISGNPKVNDVLAQEPAKPTSSKGFKADEGDASLPKDKELFSRGELLNFSQLDRSKSVEAHDFCTKIAEEMLISDNMQTDNNSNIRAPDTFDLPPDDSSDSAKKIPSEATYNVKDDTTAADTVVSEVLVSESHPEDDAGSYMPNSSSEKSDDIDSFDQEVAKSMMTVLLPRALPLLKTFSRRKRKNMKSSKNFQSDEGNSNTGLCHNFASTELAVTVHKVKLPSENCKDDVHLSHSHSVASNFGHMNSIVPDSFDDDETRRCLSNQLLIYSENAEADPTHLIQDSGTNEISRPAVSVNTDAGANDCRTGLCSRIQVAVNQGTQGGDSSKCISHLGCACSHREDYLKSNENSLYGNIHSGLQDIETLPDSIEDVITAANLTETNKSLCLPPQESSLNGRSSEMPASEIPVVATESTMMCTSLLEGVLHRDSKDTCGSKTNANLHSLPTSKLSEVSSSCQMSPGDCLPSNVTHDALNDGDLAVGNSVSYLHERGIGNITENKEVKRGAYSKAKTCLEHNKLLASYVHPKPISMVLLRKKDNEIYICALCGILELEEKTLFLYKAPIDGENMGRPSFVGHVSLILPSFKDAYGRDVALEKSGIQFTPDASSLVLQNCIKTPCCREGINHCPCGSCKADYCEKNAVKIVEVKNGFVSIVRKLKTSKSLCCILVCEPSFLIAAEESGKLYLWLMDTSWSDKTEECYLPTSDCLPPCPVELKKIPKSTSLVLGHNGLGEFCLWDIYKRILMSKFSEPSASVYQFIPVSFLGWRRKEILSADNETEEFVKEIMDLTEKWFFEMKENRGVFSIDNEDVAIWLLISSDPDQQHGYILSEPQTDSTACWRLALLTKNMMIMGSAVDPRAAAVGALDGHGIIGRNDGLVYMWELSTGINLGTFHHFKGQRASCIATEDSGSGAFAIASNGGQLSIYLQS